MRTPYPTNTDSSTTSGFSACAYAASGSSHGTLTPVPSNFTNSAYTPRVPPSPGEHSHSPSGSSKALQCPLSDASTNNLRCAPSPPAEEHHCAQLIDPVGPLRASRFVSALVPVHPTVVPSPPAATTSPPVHAASLSASSSSGSSSISSPFTASTMTTCAACPHPQNPL
ncbi:hypothetical protein FB451DRAFT_1401575 [Mycena latifolia]|nr:hypothetical protein FB451DRAFT_1401575 [Mycena latifolia]